MTKRELNKYFHPRPFVGNNIDYRIGSSASLARFKESQTYLLNQLAFNPFHKFSHTAKEILLLQFDLCFDLICELEQYLLVEQNNISFVDIEQFLLKREEYFRKTITDQNGYIDLEYFDYFEKIYEISKKRNLQIFKMIFESDMNISSKFGSVVDFFIQIMNHTLYELQELDIILYSKQTPAFNLDKMSCDMNHHIDGTCPLLERIKLMLTIRDFEHIIIKNYLDSSIPFVLTPVYSGLLDLGIKYNLV